MLTIYCGCLSQQIRDSPNIQHPHYSLLKHLYRGFPQLNGETPQLPVSGESLEPCMRTYYAEVPCLTLIVYSEAGIHSPKSGNHRIHPKVLMVNTRLER